MLSVLPYNEPHAVRRPLAVSRSTASALADLHPAADSRRFLTASYDRHLAVARAVRLPGARGGRPVVTALYADIAVIFLDHYGTFVEAGRQPWRSTTHSWHLHPVPPLRPADDYRTTKSRSPNCAYGGSWPMKCTSRPNSGGGPSFSNLTQIPSRRQRGKHSQTGCRRP